MSKTGSIPDFFPVLVACALALATGIGFVVGRFSSPVPPAYPLLLRADDRPLVPVLRWTSVQNGFVDGTSQGEVRIVLPDGSVQVLSGAFRLPVPAASRPSAAVPSSARFVASKNGTKYYAVGSAGERRIKEENKVYFADEAEAEKAGFEAGK